MDNLTFIIIFILGIICGAALSFMAHSLKKTTTFSNDQTVDNIATWAIKCIDRTLNHNEVLREQVNILAGDLLRANNDLANLRKHQQSYNQNRKFN